MARTGRTEHSQPSSRGSASAPAVPHRLLLRSIVVSLVLMAVSAAGVGACLLATSRARTRLDTFSFGAPLVVPDPQIGYVSPADSTTRRRHRDGLEYTYYRDGRGARVAAPGSPTPHEVAVLFLGGSFTIGHGVEHEETFAARAAEAWGVSMANLGTGAYGTVQSLLLLERYAELSPRLVVYGFIGEHVRRNLSPCAPSLLPFCTHVPHVDFDSEGAPYVRFPDPDAEADWQRNERFRAAATASPWGRASLATGFEILWQRARRRLERRPPPPSGDPEKRRASLAFLLRRMHAAAAGMGARLAVAFIPDLRAPHPGADAPPDELVAALDEGIELVDVSRRLRGWRGPPLTLPGDGHPSAAGHRAIAQALVQQLPAPSP